MKVVRAAEFKAVALKAPEGSRLLHPGIWFLLVWAVVLCTWGLLPETTFRQITGSDRQTSATGIAYLGLALSAFIVGTYVGPDFLLTRRGSAAQPILDRGRAVRILGWMTCIPLAVSGAALGYIIFNGVSLAGGPAAFADEVASGVSWAHLADRYFIPSRIQGITIWVQLNAAVSVLATLGLLIGGGRGTAARIFIAALIMGFLFSVIQSFALNDRLATAEFVVAATIAFIGFRVYGRQPVLTRSVVLWSVGLLIVLIALWTGGEYARTYLARYGPALVDDQGNPVEVEQTRDAGGFAGERFIGYLVSAPNNAIYAVDNFQNYTYIYRTAKGLFTAASMDSDNAPIFGPGIAEARLMLRDFYRTPEFTVYSFPGYAYTDLSWGGILVCLWFGLVIGAVHQRFAMGELWALLVYPFLFVGILDSWRISYWSESRMLVPVAFVVLAALLVSQRSPSVEPHVSRTGQEAVRV